MNLVPRWAKPVAVLGLKIALAALKVQIEQATTPPMLRDQMQGEYAELEAELLRLEATKDA
jgi:hypothetical protein